MNGYFVQRQALDDKTSLGTHPYASRIGSNVIYQQHKRLVLPKSWLDIHVTPNKSDISFWEPSKAYTFTKVYSR